VFIGFERGQSCCVNPTFTSIYRAVQILSLVFDFDIGFIYTPPLSNRAFVSTKHIIQHPHQLENPVVNCGLGNMNATIALISSGPPDSVSKFDISRYTEQ